MDGKKVSVGSVTSREGKKEIGKEKKERQQLDKEHASYGQHTHSHLHGTTHTKAAQQTIIRTTLKQLNTNTCIQTTNSTRTRITWTSTQQTPHTCTHMTALMPFGQTHFHTATQLSSIIRHAMLSWTNNHDSSTFNQEPLGNSYTCSNTT
ncbi:hypothetical protein I3842_09G133500 [Carya illinoinensis]|uniref:Uncharacterized protein n=1 Tax=Carya illinoinensis TaxID=32201 RepID=A0A922J6H2_CARIL|nr:hypothetical protein I3842_09G133400 [Carya illinoinensis]KAG6696155.1 hypothetical protein I3842_09G133500 [Carya illinoinensis]